MSTTSLYIAIMNTCAIVNHLNTAMLLYSEQRRPLYTDLYQYGTALNISSVHVTVTLT